MKSEDNTTPLPLKIVQDLISQRRVEMIMLHRFVDLQEADAVHHFRSCFSVDDGGMDGAIGEPRPQRALHRVELRGCLLHIGLEAAIGKDQFSTQGRCGHRIHRAPFKERAGDTIPQVDTDVLAIGEANLRIQCQVIGIVDGGFSADQEVDLLRVIRALRRQFFELNVVADQRAVGFELAPIVDATRCADRSGTDRECG